MPRSEKRRAADWVLRALSLTRVPVEGRQLVEYAQGRFDRRSVEMALKDLRKRGLAEKWKPPGWSGKSTPWRLTAQGELEAEDWETRSVARSTATEPRSLTEYAEVLEAENAELQKRVQES